MSNRGFKFDDDIFDSTPKFLENDIHKLYAKYLRDSEKDKKSAFHPLMSLETIPKNQTN